MATGFLLVDFPNPTTAQGSFPRRGGATLSGTCIIHTSEGPWQNGVNALTGFVRTRSDYGCYHRACDWEDIALYYPWEWETWQDSETNNWAVGIAAACRAADWAVMPANIQEGYYRNLARMAADFVTYMRSKGVTVPLRRITGAQARARVPGFCAHGDSGVNRSDPGADFNWALFFQYTAQALGTATITPQSVPAPKEPFTMGQFEDLKATSDRAVAIVTENQKRITRVSAIAAQNQREQRETNAIVTNLVAALNRVTAGEPFDEVKLLAGVRAAAAAGTAEAISSIETTVNLKGTP